MKSCAEPIYYPGGGGLNVNRALHHLDAPSLALEAPGGVTGDRFASLLKAEGIAFLALKSPGETRKSMTVTEVKPARNTAFCCPARSGPTPIRLRSLPCLPPPPAPAALR